MGALGVIEALPQLAVLQLHGNPLVPRVEQYRRTVVSRCRALTYLDDRPVFPEDRLATEAWAWAEAELGKGRGLEAEREERVRQREAREEQQRHNLEFMRKLTEDAKGRAAARMAEAGVAPGAHAQVAEAAAKAGAGTPGGEAAHSSQQMYSRALAAVEAKRCGAPRARAVRRPCLRAPCREVWCEGRALTRNPTVRPCFGRRADGSFWSASGCAPWKPRGAKGRSPPRASRARARSALPPKAPSRCRRRPSRRLPASLPPLLTTTSTLSTEPSRRAESGR